MTGQHPVEGDPDEGVTSHASAAPAPRLADHMLIFNLAMDEDDPILGFATGWVNALAVQCRRVSVITMRAGRLGTRENVCVHSAGAESGLSRPRRIARFFTLLRTIISAERVDVCFSHMMPKFSVLGGPALKVRRIPLITWYAHPSCTAWVRAAHMMSDRVVTSFPHTYPYRRDKLRVIGQAVDTDLFSPGPSGSSQRRVLYVGRVSPVKNLDVLLEAVARVRADADFSDIQLTIIGRAPSRDARYAEHLKDTVRRLGIIDAVEWISGVPHRNVVDSYRAASVHVNLTARGFGDKVALESMSCGVPCIVANDDFGDLLGDESRRLLVPPRDVARLSDRMRDVLSMSAVDRARMGRALRRSIEYDHSLSTLPQRLGRVVHEMRSPAHSGAGVS
jgi:glycosyltransferase involved in cell wall biosynthesis